MQIRNPVYLADGRIDCEVKHPHFGWIPFTADPNDCEGHGREVHAAALAIGPAPYVAPPAPAIDPAAMRCTPLQGKLALGETRWAQVEAFLADPATPWAMRIAITSESEWQRNSQTITELAWILQLTDDDVDGLFRIAATINV